MTTLLTTSKGTSELELKNSIEVFEVIFVNHAARQAKNMILTVAPNGNWFASQTQKFSFERNITVMDGAKKKTYSVDMDAEIVVNTSIGAIALTKNKAVLQ